MNTRAVGFVLAALACAIFSVASCTVGDGSQAKDDNSSSSGQGGGLTMGGGDPNTCEGAAEAHTYIGCDFYPTVNFNNVWQIFDFAAVVANGGDNTVEVTVQRGGTVVANVSIPPDSLERIFLPWVSELKGPDFSPFTSVAPPTESVRSPIGAYHLTATYPVTVYQFSALEFAPTGGPPDKDWAACPADAEHCFSYSNDASLLIPSTAWTSNYRITAIQGWPLGNMGSHMAITGLVDGTQVTVDLSATGQVMAGPSSGVNAIAAGGTGTFTINKGEVVQLLSPATADLSGSLVTATQPIQVIAGHACRHVPDDNPACDHLEETVLPAETFGERYLVTRPTGPNGDTPGHLVRIFGNFDGTTLSYPAGEPPGAPTTIDAGEVVDLGIVTIDFEVVGSASFAVGSWQLAGSLVDVAGGQLAKGDPAQSNVIAIEQYRSKYVFLAPSDYPVSYVDVIMPMTASVEIDGGPLGAAPVAIGGSTYGVARHLLTNTESGAHILEATEPVGIQVSGYGQYTSYYYPGGLDLFAISPPPPPE